MSNQNEQQIEDLDVDQAEAGEVKGGLNFTRAGSDLQKKADASIIAVAPAAKSSIIAI
jgi:hypothetical protein